MVPGLEERLIEGTPDDVLHICDMARLPFLSELYHTDLLQIQKGAASSRADDTKSLKGTILDWIDLPQVAPVARTLANLPLARNIKSNRGFHHNSTGALLCPATMDWADTE